MGKRGKLEIFLFFAALNQSFLVDKLNFIFYTYIIDDESIRTNLFQSLFIF